MRPSSDGEVALALLIWLAVVLILVIVYIAIQYEGKKALNRQKEIDVIAGFELSKQDLPATWVKTQVRQRLQELYREVVAAKEVHSQALALQANATSLEDSLGTQQAVIEAKAKRDKALTDFEQLVFWTWRKYNLGGTIFWRNLRSFLFEI